MNARMASLTLGLVVASLTAPAHAVMTNLMSNPGFESGLAGYSTSNGHFPPNAAASFSASATSTLVRSGAQSAQISVNNNNVGAPGLYLLYQDINVSTFAVGTVFTLTGYAAQSATDPMLAGPVITSYVEWFDAFGGRVDIDFLGSAGVPPAGAYPASPTWNQTRVKDVATAVTARYFFGIENGAVPDGRGTAHFDDVSFAADVVPEPASLFLAGLGGVALLARRR